MGWRRVFHQPPVMTGCVRVPKLPTAAVQGRKPPSPSLPTGKTRAGLVTTGSIKIPFSYGADHSGRDPGGTGSPEGGIMDDGQQRPRGAIGAICAQAEHKIGADPLQLDLWSALQPRYDTFEAAADQHPRAFISKSQPTRASAQ